MRRFGFAVIFLLVMALMAAGVFTQSAPDGRSLLISAAQAMEEAETIHVVGMSGPTPLPIPGIPLKLGTPPAQGTATEAWYTPQAFHETGYENGVQSYGLCGDASTGKVHRCLLRRGLVLTYDLGVEKARSLVAAYRQHFLQGTLSVDELKREFKLSQSATREEQAGGRTLKVISVPMARDDVGEVAQSTEYYLDVKDGKLVATRVVGPDAQPRPVRFSQSFEYGVSPPPQAITFTLRPGLKEQKGYFRVLEGGYIHFGVPGDGTNPAEQSNPSGASGSGAGGG